MNEGVGSAIFRNLAGGALMCEGVLIGQFVNEMGSCLQIPKLVGIPDPPTPDPPTNFADPPDPPTPTLSKYRSLACEPCELGRIDVDAQARSCRDFERTCRVEDTRSDGKFFDVGARRQVLDVSRHGDRC